MKKAIQFVNRIGLFLLFAIVLVAGRVDAASYTWTPTAAGTYNWNDATSKWTSGFPNATDDVASLRIDLLGAQTINLNQAITVGTINLGDSTSTYYPVNITAGTSDSLIMAATSGTAIIARTGANNVRDYISANIQLNDNLVVSDASGSDSDGGNFSLTLSGNITGSGKSLTKNGSGAVTLSGANTYSGGTILNGGGFFRINTNSIGTGPLTINNTGSEVDITSGNQPLSGNAVIINGYFKSHYGFVTGPGPVTITNTVSMLGSITIQGVVSGPGGSNTFNALDIIMENSGGWGANPALTANITMRTNQTVTCNTGYYWYGSISGSIVDGGNGYALTKGGAGRLHLSGTNTYSGDTTISAGELTIGRLALQNSALISKASSVGLTTSTLTLGGLKGSIDLNSVFNIALDPGVVAYSTLTSLTLNPLAGHTNTYFGAITNSTMTLNKTGVGTQILSGSNNYSGATSVGAGTLLVNGSINSAVTVDSGASFGGTGVVQGVTLSSGAKAVFTSGAPMTFNGFLTLNDNVVRVNLPDGLKPGTYRVANFTAGKSGTFAKNAVIDSGSVIGGSPIIVMGSGTVDVSVPALGFLMTLR